MNANFLFPTNGTTAIFEYFKFLETEIPAELSLIFHAGYRPDLGGELSLLAEGTMYAI